MVSAPQRISIATYRQGNTIQNNFIVSMVLNDSVLGWDSISGDILKGDCVIGGVGGGNRRTGKTGL